MAIYDAAADRVAVRVVYDGAGTAGKTTNLHQLAAVYSLDRRSELVSPGQTAGRTTFFDWLHLDSGHVASKSLRTEFVTVPGQRVLARRRFALLDEADVVVFVVDSRATKIAESRQMWLTLRAHVDRSRPAEKIPIVVQANKRDLLGTVSPAELRQELELDETTPLVEAIASEDVGVRETAVLAIRAARVRLVALLERQPWSTWEGTSRSPEELKRHLEELERRSPLSPAALLLGGLPPMENGPRSSSPAANGAPEAGICLPPRPTGEEESGWIWPPTTGRALLRSLANRPGRTDVTGATGVRELIVDGRRFVVELRRHPDLDSARRELLGLARERAQLGDLLPSELVLALTRAEDGDVSRWIFLPVLEDLASRASRAIERADVPALVAALGRCADALVEGALVASRLGLALHLGPSDFAEENGTLRYVGRIVREGDRVAPWGHRAAFWLEADTLVAARPHFFERLATGLAERLDRSELEQLDLASSFRSEAASHLRLRSEFSRAITDALRVLTSKS